MTRREEREHALIALFESSFGFEPIESVVQQLNEEGEYVIDEYSQRLLDTYFAHSAEIDAIIQNKLIDWTMERIPRICLAILRLSICEMQYIEEVPDSIAINEAVEITKKYADDGDYQFINGVLGSISRGKEVAE